MTATTPAGPLTTPESETTMNTFDTRGAAISASTLQGGRAYQQDAYAWRRATDRNTPTQRFPKPYGFIVAAVADGMGSGAGSGPIAQRSVMISSSIASAYGPDRLTNAITATGDVMREQEDNRGAEDNTTLVLATVDDRGTVDAAWVGDSRAYVLSRKGRLHRLTQDHNYAPRYPSILSRSLLGLPGHGHQADDSVCICRAPEHGSYTSAAYITDPVAMVMLCTDGVCGVLNDGEIADILRMAPNGRRAALRLTNEAVRRATEKGVEKPDNATAVVIDLFPRDAEERRAGLID